MKDEDKAELAQFVQKDHCSFEGADACDECQKKGIRCPTIRIREEGDYERYEHAYDR